MTLLGRLPEPTKSSRGDARPSRWAGIFLLGAAAVVGNSFLILSPVAGQSKPRRSLWKSADIRPPGMPATNMVPPRSIKPTVTDDETQQTTEKEFTGKGTVQLNYYGAGWETVFRDLADGTNSRLIANRIPSGRFTRRDTKEYTRQEAVRILNIEIEPKGFRLIEQDEMLVVMDIPDVRPRYQPAEVKSSLQRMAERQAAQQPAQPQAPTVNEAPPTPTANTRPRQDNAVRPVRHEEPAAPNPFGAEPEAAPIPRPAVDDPLTVVIFRARHRHAMEISKQIYLAYPKRTELLSASADGLPAFRVRHAVDGAQLALQFDVTVDSANEEVRIEARKSQSKSVIRLFRALDVPKEEGRQYLYSRSPSVCRIAAQMVPQMEQLRRQRAAQAKTADRREDSWRPVSQEEEVPPEPPAPAESDDPKTPSRDIRQMIPPQFSDVIGDLTGPVVIESIEDIGALILRGREDDVEKVMEVIKQLEKLSELTAPQVHLEHLQHVDSRALAALLTSVFERLTKFPGRATQPRQNVAILSVTKPNAILIIAPLADLESIRELAQELDQPVDPQTEFQVFQLKTAIATQVAELLTDFYENQTENQDDERGLSTRIQVQADARTNSVIVRARPRDLDEAAALIKKMDRETTASVSQAKIFSLKYAGAAEIAAILNQAIQSVIAPPLQTSGGNNQFGGGQGGGLGGTAQIPEELRGVKSTVIQFLAVDSEGERLLRSGMLTDIKITPDARQNVLVVTAPERSMDLIGELIKQLDLPSAAVQEIKVFPLINADATKVVQQLQQLFSPQGQQGGGFNNQQRQALGIQVLGADDAGSSLIPMRFSVDTRTNSVIAIGGAEALGVVEAILLRLDEGDIRERQQAVYRLKNSPAVAIAQAVTQFLQSQRDLSRQDPNLISSVEQLEREVIVVAEPVSNSLLISATPRYFEEIQRLVKKLDEAPAQVMIQALIVEVTLENTDEFGIEMGFQDSVLFDRSVLDPPEFLTTTTTAPNGTQTTTQTVISQTATPGFNFNNPALPLGNNISQHPGRVASQGLSNFSLGRINGDLGFGGLVLSAGSESVNVLLRALSSSRRLQVLSRPQIRTLDNQTATVQQGQIVPIVGSVTVTNGFSTPNISQDPAGIILTVTPRISPDGQIVMDMVAEKSAYNLDGVPIFTDSNTGNVVTSPIKDIATARAVVSVPNNQTVVIGGLINSTDDRTSRKVPWLGDIPVLGYLFRYDSVRTNRRELLIFLTPRLVREDAESEMIKDVEMARMHFIECEAEEIHGPLRGVPAEFPALDNEPAWIQPDGTLSPLPPGAMQPPLPPGTVIPNQVMPPPPAPKAEQPAIPPEPPEPGLLNDNIDEELFDVPAPPPESRRIKMPPADGGIQHANHESVRSQTPGARIIRPTAPQPPLQQPGVWKSSSKKSAAKPAQDSRKNSGA